MDHPTDTGALLLEFIQIIIYLFTPGNLLLTLSLLGGGRGEEGEEGKMKEEEGEKEGESSCDLQYKYRFKAEQSRNSRSPQA